MNYQERRKVIEALHQFSPGHAVEDEGPTATFLIFCFLAFVGAVTLFVGLVYLVGRMVI
jgi:hypothetical protein